MSCPLDYMKYGSYTVSFLGEFFIGKKVLHTCLYYPWSTTMCAFYTEDGQRTQGLFFFFFYLMQAYLHNHTELANALRGQDSTLPVQFRVHL